MARYRRNRRILAWISLIPLLVACSGPSIPVPPPPTPEPVARRSLSTHTHGQIAANSLPLMTIYGGATRVSTNVQPPDPVPMSPFTVTYTLRSEAGEPVTADRLQLAHERLMHMFIVSEDLNSFSHIHPNDEGDGRYSVSSSVSSPGRYVMFNTFVDAGGKLQVERDPFTTAGAGMGGAPATLTPDLGVAKMADGLEITMDSDRKALRRVPISFSISVREGGQPVTDMQPYLGAVFHAVIISADTRQFAHTHGDVAGGLMAGDKGGMVMGGGMAMPTPPPRFGPDLEFTHTFMQPGLYRIWVQLQRKGQIYTVSYDVQVSK